MSNRLTLTSKNSSRDRIQAYTLLLLGVVFLVLAWLFHPSTGEYPVGVLLFGLGMLVASLINPFGLMYLAATFTKTKDQNYG